VKRRTVTLETHPTSLSVGPEVEPSPAKRPHRIRLEGRIVTLAPLDPVGHGDALYNGSHGKENEHLWRYLREGPFPDRATFNSQLQQKAASDDPLVLTIMDNASGEAVGYAAYMRIEPAHRVIEVGSILYTRRLQRTVGATEAMYLMARHVFEDLCYRRYEWKCDALNAPSRKAALRLGFTFEGIFRQHMIMKGRNRDTAWFSMLDSEWPARKRTLQQWLDPANFDAQGRQKVSLSELNRGSDLQPQPIRRASAEHYTWGSNCDGWHLVKDAKLSVIQEQMPPGTAEVLHYHGEAQQFFYLLSGEAELEVEGRHLRLPRPRSWLCQRLPRF